MERRRGLLLRTDGARYLVEIVTSSSGCDETIVYQELELSRGPALDSEIVLVDPIKVWVRVNSQTSKGYQEVEVITKEGDRMVLYQCC